MGKINVLGFDIANLIAAGEVVDRPASVVKELLENAIDAGAHAITVEIQRGGASFIRVSDNGCGIAYEDLPLAILRHATSKIARAEDLESIATLGFRGEALAATAAVSKLRILSKTKDSSFGSLLEASGGEDVTVSETGCADGTTVIVEDLFFNVPARRKFLKKDATETAAVTGVVEKAALSVPDIAIKYIADGEVRFVTSGDGRLDGVIYALYGREVAKRILHVDRTDGGIRVSGYISEADFVRSNRNMENFFINGRFVKSRTAMAAVEQAYVSKMQADKFPFCVLNIELNPAAVDVNVHPSKLEVKFSNERIIFDAIYYTVLGALETSASRPELSFTGQTVPNVKPELPEALFGKKSAAKPDKQPSAPQKPAPGSAFLTGEDARRVLNAFVPVEGRGEYATRRKDQLSLHIPATEKTAASAPIPPRPAAPVMQTPAVPPIAPEKPVAAAVAAPATKPAEAPTKPAAEEPSPAPIPPYLILGEAYNCYVILQLEDRLLVVDKHAAHERILFDQLCAAMRTREKRAQILMFPIEVTLTAAECDAAREYDAQLRSMGFGFRIEDGKCLLSEIPEELSRDQAEDVLVTMAGRLAEGAGSVESAGAEFFETTLWQAACKAAIKGGRQYGEAHIRWICDRILQAPDKGGSVIKTCPHGRPVAFEIKKSSLERQFARLQ